MLPGDLMEAISSTEINELMALDSIDPIFTGRRLDLAAAQICKIMADIHCRPDKNSPEFKVGQFIQEHDPERKKAARTHQTADEMLVMVQTLNILYGGKEIKKDGECSNADSSASR